MFTLIALFPALVSALITFVFGFSSTTPLIALGFVVWLIYSFSDIKFVWKHPDLDLELDLVHDGFKGVGLFIVYTIAQAITWHMYIPNIIVYKAYLVVYYAAYTALGYGAAGALQIGLSFGLWLIRKRGRPDE